MRYYSCDSHVVEPASVFDGFDREFGSRAPRIETVPDKGEFIVLLGPTAINMMEAFS